MALSPFYSEVFESFRDLYPRATDFCQGFFNLTDDRVILWIAKDSAKWRNFKKAVKYVANTYGGVEVWANYDYYTVVKYFRRVINREALETWPEVVDSPKQLRLF